MIPFFYNFIFSPSYKTNQIKVTYTPSIMINKGNAIN